MPSKGKVEEIISYIRSKQTFQKKANLKGQYNSPKREKRNEKLERIEKKKNKSNLGNNGYLDRVDGVYFN